MEYLCLSPCKIDRAHIIHLGLGWWIRPVADPMFSHHYYLFIIFYSVTYTIMNTRRRSCREVRLCIFIATHKSTSSHNNNGLFFIHQNILFSRDFSVRVSRADVILYMYCLALVILQRSYTTNKSRVT